MPSKRKKVVLDLTRDDSDEGSVAKRPKATLPPSTTERSADLHGTFARDITANHRHEEGERQAWLAAADDDDDEDIFSLVPSTQAAAANTEQLHLYGNLSTKIVGVRYYRGHANPGQQILMRREPGNVYDKNAIRVDNVEHTQIGHIPRKIAEKLAPFMDRGSIHCEGELTGQIGEYDCPVLVKLWATHPHSEEGRKLAAEMKAAKLPLDALTAAARAEKQREKQKQEEKKRREREEKARLAAARKAAAAGGKGTGASIPSSTNSNGWVNQSQAGPSSQPILSDILEASERFNPRQTGSAADQYGLQEQALQHMPTTTKPNGIKTPMLRYQLQALRWLLDQEQPQLPLNASQQAVQLWKREHSTTRLYTNIATNFSVEAPPTLVSGGILADDMGLGKTLEMISLIVADNEQAGQRTGTTLIVAPLSVMSNWSGQIEQHMHADRALSVYVYHGAGRVPMKAGDFSGYDVVITTYQTLASDYMPKSTGAGVKPPAKKIRSSGLYSVEWRRVILDEGHIVRNPMSKGAGAVTSLSAKSRWVLTGTPLVNSLRDLYSLLKFLGISGGLENLEIFNRVLVRPLKQGDASATDLLKAIMAAFTLRRKKEMSFVDLRLPKLDEYVHRITFSEKEKERYQALAAEAQGLFRQYESKAQRSGNGAGAAFHHLLEILLRMRQSCNHWHLCGERVTQLLAQITDARKTVILNPENTRALQDVLRVRIQTLDECPVCIDTLHDPVVTACAHAFCRECITKVIETQGKCPICRAELTEEMIVGPRPESDDAEDSAASPDANDPNPSSSKLDSIVEILAATRASGDKTVLFSQWTRFLDIVQARLVREGYKVCRLDGSMRAGERDAALAALADDPECTVLLASLGVCAVGLNLTAANQVILSDTWWAPAIEDQAIDRVHRLGQTKPTRVFRLVMDGSIEEQTLQIQQEKRKLMQLALNEKAGKRDHVKSGGLQDIRRLLIGGEGN